MRVKKMDRKFYKKYSKRPEIKKRMQQPKKIDPYDEIIKKIIKRSILWQRNQT